MWTIRPWAMGCQQPSGYSGRAAGVPLIIYLRFDGGNRSSVATTKQWLIKACLFRNQNLLLNRLLHLVPIISSSSPSHMLNSTHMWVLHHIRMRVFLWCAVHLCVRHPLLHHVAFERRVSFCIYGSVIDFVRRQHLRVFPPFDLCPFSTLKCQHAVLPGPRIFPLANAAWPEWEVGFRGIIMVYIVAPTAASHYHRRRTWSSGGGTSCFVLTLPQLTDLKHLLSRLWALTFSTFCSCQASCGGWGQRKALCSLLRF